MKRSRKDDELAFSTSVTPLQQLWRRAADKAIPREIGLSHALAWPLVIVNGKGALPQAELANLLGIEQSSLARLVDQLCDAGLVDRKPDSSDRRVNLIQLTPDGARWSQTLEEQVASFRADALKGVSTDDLKTCLKVFAQIRSNLADSASPKMARAARRKAKSNSEAVS